MKTKSKIASLRQLQSRIDNVREKRGINSPHAVLYQEFLADGCEELVVVESDGIGGAKTSVVEGNYPLEYIVKNEKKFRREQTAIDAAMRIVEESVAPELVLS